MQSQQQQQRQRHYALIVEKLSKTTPITKTVTNTMSVMRLLPLIGICLLLLLVKQISGLSVSQQKSKTYNNAGGGGSGGAAATAIVERPPSPSSQEQQELHQRCASSSSCSVLEKNGGIVYRQSVFTTKEFDIIKNEVASLTKSKNKLQEESTSSIAINRLGMTLSKNNPIVQLLEDKSNSLHQLIQKTTTSMARNNDDEYILSKHLPVEVRTYEKLGASMSWHVDDQLYDIPQIEIVFTVENTSDCTTMWKPKTTPEVINSQDTDPNSCLIIQSGVENGPEHCVTSLKRNGGKRIIIKCAYHAKNAVFNDSLYTQHQFGDSDNKKNKHNKQNKKNSKRNNRKR